MSKVEERGPIAPPPSLCLCVTFITLCLLGLTLEGIGVGGGLTPLPQFFLALIFSLTDYQKALAQLFFFLFFKTSFIPK